MRLLTRLALPSIRLSVLGVPVLPERSRWHQRDRRLGKKMRRTVSWVYLASICRCSMVRVRVLSIVWNSLFSIHSRVTDKNILAAAPSPFRHCQYVEARRPNFEDDFAMTNREMRLSLCTVSYHKPSFSPERAHFWHF